MSPVIEAWIWELIISCASTDCLNTNFPFSLIQRNKTYTTLSSLSYLLSAVFQFFNLAGIFHALLWWNLVRHIMCVILEIFNFDILSVLQKSCKDSIRNSCITFTPTVQAFLFWPIYFIILSFLSHILFYMHICILFFLIHLRVSSRHCVPVPPNITVSKSEN